MDISRLKKEQLKLAKEIITRDEIEKKEFIAGVDQAFIGEKVISGIVVMKIRSLEIVEKKYAVVDSKIPYIPGYQSYREGPAIVEAFNKLDQKPDILMVDSNGILHQRRIGMASHIGILLDMPTIGISKNLTFGDVKGSKIYVETEMRGIEVKTKAHAKPIYVSPGHKVSMGTSVELVKNSMKPPHKLPEPLHAAHRYVNKIAKDLSPK